MARGSTAVEDDPTAEAEPEPEEAEDEAGSPEDAEAEASFNEIPDADVGEAAGQSIEDVAEEREPEPPLEGDWQLSLIAGGEAPTSASIHLRGGSMPLEGAFEKGQHVRLIVECVVAEVHFIDKADKWGNVVSTERKHVAKRAWVRRAAEPTQDARAEAGD